MKILSPASVGDSHGPQRMNPTALDMQTNFSAPSVQMTKMSVCFNALPPAKLMSF